MKCDKECKEKVKQYVKDNPKKVMIASFVGGTILGSLLMWRKKK